LPVYQSEERNLIQEILYAYFDESKGSHGNQCTEKYGKYKIMHTKETTEKSILRNAMKTFHYFYY
jgi:hypothetical protein